MVLAGFNSQYIYYILALLLVTLTIQVCVPFLLLCFGMDPKSDVTNIVSRFHSNKPSSSSTADATATPKGIPPQSTSSSDVIATPEGPNCTTTSFVGLSVTPTPLRGAESANEMANEGKNDVNSQSACTTVTVDILITAHYRGLMIFIAILIQACPVVEGEEPQRSTGSISVFKGAVYSVGSILSNVRSSQVLTYCQYTHNIMGCR